MTYPNTTPALCESRRRLRGTPGAQPALWGLLADRFDLHLFPIRRRLIRDPGDDKYTPGARS